MFFYTLILLKQIEVFYLNNKNFLLKFSQHLWYKNAHEFNPNSNLKFQAESVGFINSVISGLLPELVDDSLSCSE